jgi:glycosyltransferase involved in cell wall biosynthesis
VSGPGVSIIIPVYNAAEHLRESLDSVLAQDYGELEVVAVNDGSTDGSGRILWEYRNEGVRLVDQENRGQCGALNRGIEEAGGDCIKFFDADDVMNEGHISAQVEALGGRHDVVASCRWGAFYRRPSEAQFRPETTHRNYDDPMDWIVDSLTRDVGMMGGWMWLIPAPVLERAGRWDTRLSLNNDFDFSIRVLLASRGVRFAGGARLYYRKGTEESLTQRADRQALESAFLTTRLGTEHILAHEDSERTRRICADRFKHWLFRFYPSFPDLARRTEEEIARLGGSDLQPQGGAIFRALRTCLGWKRARWLQYQAHRAGWGTVARAKRRWKRWRQSGPCGR